MRWHIPLVILLAALAGFAASAVARPTDDAGHSAARAPLFEIDGYASDPDYGYRPTRPILLGGIDLAKRPDEYDLAERTALLQQLLKAPNGETLTWQRAQPCCPLGPSQGGADGQGLLDVYLVSAPGQRPIRMFVNHYKAGPVQAPIGFVYHRSPETGRSVHEALTLASAGNEDRAIGMLTPLAEAGDILARFYLGVLYLRAKDPAAAARWFERAAEQEHGPSQMALASAYRRGNGVERNPARATKWLVRAARNRDPLARRHLAQVEAEESNRTGDWRKANYHLYLSAEQGLAAAQRDNGEAFVAGTGREKDMPSGLFWLAAAGMAQDAQASALFEKFCAPISGREKSAIEKRARDFWDRPQPSDHVATLTYDASVGDSRARYELGLLTITGIEIEPDKEAGLLLLALSAAAGDARAMRAFADLEKTESADLIAQIKRSADALTHSPNR